MFETIPTPDRLADQREEATTFAGDCLDSARLTLREGCKALDNLGVEHGAVHAIRQSILSIDLAMSELAE